jgi:hypothetical protein
MGSFFVSAWRMFERNWQRFWRPHIRPKFEITGVEVVQAVQRFDLNDPTRRNSVPLVAHKRTLARVYATPAGESRPGAAISGELSVSRPEGGRRSAGSPLNAGMTVRPAAQIDRNDLNQTLNFLLPPAQLTGSVELRAKVYLASPLMRLLGPSAAFTLSLDFVERKLPWKFKRLLVGNGGIPPPSVADFNRSLDTLAACYPAPDIDFDASAVAPLPGYESIVNDSDLHQATGWPELFSQIENIMANFDLDGFVVAALLHAPPGVYAGLQGMPIVFVDGITFAHELGHKYGLADLHSDDQFAFTDEPGVDLSKRPPQLVRQNSPDIMFFMSSSPTWCSTHTWETLFHKFNP